MTKLKIAFRLKILNSVRLYACTKTSTNAFKSRWHAAVDSAEHNCEILPRTRGLAARSK
jgi:hypothetical protein